MPAHKLNRLRKLFRACRIRMTENYACRRFYLVVEKLAEVFHIHFALYRVDNRGIRIDFAIFELCAFNRFYNVGKLAHARRFY